MATHPKLYGKWYDRILNTWPFMVDDVLIDTVGIAWIFIENDKWHFLPRITGDHQYYNAQFFVRFSISWLFATVLWLCVLPFALRQGVFHTIGFTATYLPSSLIWSVFSHSPLAFFFGMRFSSHALFQGGVGWKQNGRFAVHFRFQSDASAAAGTTSPNYGQATGWNYGEH